MIARRFCDTKEKRHKKSMAIKASKTQPKKKYKNKSRKDIKAYM
jgi:hypothetical protein